MKTEKKKKELTRGPNPPRFNLQVMRVNFFLRVKNINPPRQKVRVMQVRPVLPSLVSMNFNITIPKEAHSVVHLVNMVHHTLFNFG